MDRRDNQEAGPPHGKRLLALAMAGTMLISCAAMAPKGFALDLGVDRAGGHAALKVGSATVKFAFAFGHKCSETDACPIVQ